MIDRLISALIALSMAFLVWMYMRSRDLDTRLIVLAEPEIQVGDCRIEWADGGVNRDRSATEAVIDEAVTRYVKARLAAATTT